MGRRASATDTIIFYGKPGQFVSHYDWQYWNPMPGDAGDRHESFRAGSLASRVLAILAIDHNVGREFNHGDLLPMIGEEITDVNVERLTCQLRRHRNTLPITVAKRDGILYCSMTEKVIWR